jgi:hypothetical protein
MPWSRRWGSMFSIVVVEIGSERFRETSYNLILWSVGPFVAIATRRPVA